MAPRTRHAHYDPDIARTIVRRVAAGETLRSLWGDPAVPGCRTMRRWRRAHRDFDRALDAAVNLARRRRHLALSPHGWPMREQIIVRLANGEGLKQIAAQPGMPSTSVIYDWIHREPEFREAIIVARELAIEAITEQCEELGLLATLETAKDAYAQLQRLHWRASKLAGKTFSATKAEPEELPALADPSGWTAAYLSFVQPAAEHARRHGL
jgi:hypothetical protein